MYITGYCLLYCSGHCLFFIYLHFRINYRFQTYLSIWNLQISNSIGFFNEPRMACVLLIFLKEIVSRLFRNRKLIFCCKISKCLFWRTVSILSFINWYPEKIIWELICTLNFVCCRKIFLLVQTARTNSPFNKHIDKVCDNVSVLARIHSVKCTSSIGTYSVSIFAEYSMVCSHWQQDVKASIPQVANSWK